MKTYVKNLLVFICICTVMALLLATTNYFTAPIIEENNIKATNNALKEVMPAGESFEKIDISSLTLPEKVTEVYKETKGAGYVVKLTTSGYGSGMVIMCGVDMNGTVTGATCISSNETLGYEKTFGQNFADKNNAEIDLVDTVASATKTTEAYKNAVIDAVNTANVLAKENGGAK